MLGASKNNNGEDFIVVKLTSFTVSQLYANDEIFQSLEIGNAGGVRVKTASDGSVERIAIFTSIVSARQRSENPYHDRIEDDVLVYTGAGKTGDQVLSGVNSRLFQQIDDGFPIYGFMQVASRRESGHGPRRWVFIGLLQVIRRLKERQIDTLGAGRNVWVFELRIHAQPSTVEIADEHRIIREITLGNSHGEEFDNSEIVSPTELDSPAASNQFELLESTRRRLLTFEPRKFEYFIHDLLERSGFVRIEVTKFSHDGGIDLNARPGKSGWPIRSILIQLQAKRWLHTVGRREVAELRGSLQSHAAGCIVTTSHFSRAALKESTELGKAPVTLIDGYELALLVNEMGLSFD